MKQYIVSYPHMTYLFPKYLARVVKISFVSNKAEGGGVGRRDNRRLRRVEMDHRVSMRFYLVNNYSSQMFS